MKKSALKIEPCHTATDPANQMGKHFPEGSPVRVDIETAMEGIPIVRLRISMYRCQWDIWQTRIGGDPRPQLLQYRSVLRLGFKTEPAPP